MGRFVSLGLFAVFLTFLAPGQGFSDTHGDCGPVPGRLVYDVSNGDDKVGEITIDVSRRDADLAIRTKVAAVVTLLMIPIYRYSHQSTEIWRNGGFLSVQGWTLDAGRRYDVTISPGTKKRYLVRRNGKDNEVNGVLLSRMIWCRDAFAGGNIVSTTTGRARPIPVEDLGIESRDAKDSAGDDIPVGPKGTRYYRFTRKKRIGYIWYGADGIIAKVAYPTRYGAMATLTRTR
jgi:hypothetical protein